MIIVSYDIQDDKLRGKFTKMLRAKGAVRLQFSVYEVNNGACENFRGKKTAA